MFKSFLLKLIKNIANNSSEFDDSSPCFGHKQKIKPEIHKKEEEENRNFFNAGKEFDNECSNSGKLKEVVNNYDINRQ